MYNASGQNYNVNRVSAGNGTNSQNVPQEQSESQQASQNVSKNVLQNLPQILPQNSQQMMQNDPSVPRVPTVTYDPHDKGNPINKDDVRNIYETPKMPNVPIEPSVPSIPNPPNAPKVQDYIPNMPEVGASRKTIDDDSDSDSDNHERVVHRNVRTSKLRSTQDEPQQILNTLNSSGTAATFLHREHCSIAFDGALRSNFSHCHLLLDSHSTGV